jgi:hypothetical protein
LTRVGIFLIGPAVLLPLGIWSVPDPNGATRFVGYLLLAVEAIPMLLSSASRYGAARSFGHG